MGAAVRSSDLFEQAEAFRRRAALFRRFDYLASAEALERRAEHLEVAARDVLDLECLRAQGFGVALGVSRVVG